jgi:hypothetical protein
MTAPRFLLLAALLAAFTPLLSSGSKVQGAASIPAWPHEFQGRPLTPVAMSTDERRFLAGFPGDVARFTDGERDIVLRWVTRPTRQLHPAEDCYRAMGYQVSATRLHADRDGSRWRCFEVKRAGVTRSVCEQLRDREGTHWTDVSSWYWSATLEQTEGPWLVTTIAR